MALTISTSPNSSSDLPVFGGFKAAIARLDAERPGWREEAAEQRRRLEDAERAEIAAISEEVARRRGWTGAAAAERAESDGRARRVASDLAGGRFGGAWLHGPQAAETAANVAALWAVGGRGDVRRTTWQQVRSDLREDAESRVTQRLRTAALLVLSGVGDTPAEPWVVSALLNVANDRRDAGLPTVVACVATARDWAAMESQRGTDVAALCRVLAGQRCLGVRCEGL